MGGLVSVGVFCVGGRAQPAVDPDATSSSAAPEARLEGAFHDLTQYRFNQAAATFAELAREADWPRRRDALFGRGVALFNVQPQSPARIEEAAVALAFVRDVDPTDDLGLAARYFLARVDQVHRSPADPAAALAQWRALAEERPDHYLGQLALVRLALMELYAPALPAERRAVFERFSRAAPPWVDDHLAALYHTVMGDAIMVVWQDAVWATRHYRFVTQAPEARRLTLTDALVRMGEAARQAGVADVARDAYQEFLTASPRDPRAWVVRQHLAALEEPAP